MEGEEAGRGRVDDRDVDVGAGDWQAGFAEGGELPGDAVTEWDLVGGAGGGGSEGDAGGPGVVHPAWGDRNESAGRGVGEHGVGVVGSDRDRDG